MIETSNITSHAQLQGVTANQHHAQLHGAQHIDGAGDAVGFPLGHIRIRKPSNESRTSTVTLAGDNDFFFVVPANYIYHIRLWLLLDEAATPGGLYKASMSVPVGCTGAWSVLSANGAGALASYVAATSLSTVLTYGGDSVNPNVAVVDAMVNNGATQGVWSFNWAQNSSSVNASIELAGSMLIAHRIA